MFDNNGILFKTSANLVNLYNNAGTMGLIYSPIGSDVDATTVVGTPTVTAAVAAVPEPATWAMMIVGMGTIGFAMRRKTSRPASSSPEGRIPRA